MHPQATPSVDVREAARRLDEPADPAPLLVDVRERGEFAMLRVPGAVLLPLSEFAAGYERLPRDRPLLMLCAAGTRSQVTTEYLLRQGFPDVANVVGGIGAWRAAGLPVHGGPVSAAEGALPDTG
jgi:rhodanese-related sulfurtransferase